MNDAELHAIVMDLIRRLETLEQNIERLNYRSALETIPSDRTTTTIAAMPIVPWTTTETFSEVKDN